MYSKRLRGLSTQENKAATALLRSFERAKNRATISWADKALVHPKTASDLNAANPFARSLWGNALWSEFVTQLDLSEDQPIPEAPLFWVTVCDVACMTALDDRNVDLAPIIRHLRSVLRGLSYLGMVDVALYANIAPGTNFDRTHRPQLAPASVCLGDNAEGNEVALENLERLGWQLPPRLFRDLKDAAFIGTK